MDTTPYLSRTPEETVSVDFFVWRYIIIISKVPPSSFLSQYKVLQVYLNMFKILHASFPVVPEVICSKTIYCSYVLDYLRYRCGTVFVLQV